MKSRAFAYGGGLLSGISVSSVLVVRATIEISLVFVRDLSFMIDKLRWIRHHTCSQWIRATR
jgi:hypothetical protein